MSTLPLVSVVVPTRNSARFVGEALRSVVAQDYHPREILVIDAGSTDGTREIVAQHASSGVRLIDQQSRGIAAAWNEAIAATSGEYLAFLSSDDRWLPGKLAHQLQVMRDEPDLGYTITHFRYFLEPDCPIPATFNRNLLGQSLVGRIMETLVVRRSVYETIGTYDTAFRTAEDVDWYSRAKDAGIPMRILDNVYLEKRIHDDNLSTSGALNTPHLMEALRRSIQRRREGGT
ncbi:MAG: glycosyltransferase family 2 protein [Gemmatimonadales bacterium]